MAAALWGVATAPLARVRLPKVPLSDAQRRVWFLDLLRPGHPSYNIPVALGLRGLVEGRALQVTFEAIVARHEILGERVLATDGRPVQTFAPAGTVDHNTRLTERGGWQVVLDFVRLESEPPNHGRTAPGLSASR